MTDPERTPYGEMGMIPVSAFEDPTDSGTSQPYKDYDFNTLLTIYLDNRAIMLSAQSKVRSI